MKIVLATAFSFGALLTAWWGAYADTFVFPWDEVSARQLGSPLFAYPVVLATHLIAATVGSIIFGMSLLGVRIPERFRGGRGVVLTAILGSSYSLALVGFGQLATWSGSSAAILLWAAVLGLPIALSRLVGIPAAGRGK